MIRVLLFIFILCVSFESQSQTDSSFSSVTTKTDTTSFVRFSNKTVVEGAIVNKLGKALGEKKYQHYASKLKNISLYVCIGNQFYLYNSINNNLMSIAANCKCDFISKGNRLSPPVKFYFVADINSDQEKIKRESFYLSSITNFISHDISMYCTNEGLFSVIGDSDYVPSTLSDSLELKSTQQILMCQAVGYISAD